MDTHTGHHTSVCLLSCSPAWAVNWEKYFKVVLCGILTQRKRKLPESVIYRHVLLVYVCLMHAHVITLPDQSCWAPRNLTAASKASRKHSYIFALLALSQTVVTPLRWGSVHLKPFDLSKPPSSSLEIVFWAEREHSRDTETHSAGHIWASLWRPEVT